MNSQRITMLIPMFLTGILILSACSTPTQVFPTEQEDDVEITGTATSVPDTSVPGTAIPAIEETPTTGESVDEVPEFEIISLLPKDAIRSIDEPEFYSVSEADEEYSPEEFVIGVEFDGEARAYSVPLLSSREIVNDTISGRPIAVTW